MLLKYIVVIVTCKHCKQVSQKLRSNVHAVGDALICSIVQLMLRLPLMMHRLKRFNFVHAHCIFNVVRYLLTCSHHLLLLCLKPKAASKGRSLENKSLTFEEAVKVIVVQCNGITMTTQCL